MRFVFFILLVVINLLAIDASMDIVKNVSNVKTVAVVKTADSSSDVISEKLFNLILKDFEVSCHFKVLENKMDNVTLDSMPSFVNNSADLTLLLAIDSTQPQISVNLRLYDTNTKKLLLNNKISLDNANMYPFLAHKTLNLINDFIQAPSIGWMNNFVILSRYISPKESEIIIADYTLTYQKVIVKGGLNLFPIWANSKQDSFYYSTFKDYPTLMQYSLFDKTQKSIASSDGMIVCSDVDFENNRLLLTMAPNTQSDIYMYDIVNANKQRLTNYGGIDVGGKFLSNNTQFAFISDRLKSPAIFVQDLKPTTVVTKIPNGGKNTSSFSVYGDFLAYSSKEPDDKDFNIYLISTTNSFKKQLTINGKNEFPRFSQNGEAVLFVKKELGKSMIGVYRVGYDQSFFFESKIGSLQSIDW